MHLDEGHPADLCHVLLHFHCDVGSIDFADIFMNAEGESMINKSIRELENNKCLFTIRIKPNEPTTYEMNIIIFKFWKKRIIEFSNYFNKKK